MKLIVQRPVEVEAVAIKCEGDKGEPMWLLDAE